LHSYSDLVGSKWPKWLKFIGDFWGILRSWVDLQWIKYTIELIEVQNWRFTVELTGISIESYRIDCNSVQISSNQFKMVQNEGFTEGLTGISIESYRIDCKWLKMRSKLKVSKWIYYKKHLLQGKIKCSDYIYDFYHF